MSQDKLKDLLWGVLLTTTGAAGGFIIEHAYNGIQSQEVTRRNVFDATIPRPFFHRPIVCPLCGSDAKLNALDGTLDWYECENHHRTSCKHGTANVFSSRPKPEGIYSKWAEPIFLDRAK